jgi:uncharacterized membrane protein
MFFAYLVLRPSAGPLEAPVRLQLWERVFSRFFPWVWTSAATLLASGLGMVFGGYGGSWRWERMFTSCWASAF